MAEFVRCIFVFVIICMEFLISGVTVQKIFKLNLKLYETWIAGFFLYFGVFQIVALPLVILQIPFHVLCYLWLAVCIIWDGLVVIFFRNEMKSVIHQMHVWMKQQRGGLLAGAVFCILFTCCFHGIQQYVSWDTSYYIGTVNTTLYTDTMYVYNGNSGIREGYLELRYALSTFYMHSAVFCRLGHISALMLQKYVMGSVCICMHGLMVFSIGKKLFREDDRQALKLLILEIVLNYGFCTIYTTSSFLLIRAYEAKGFCANVILTGIFYIALCFRSTTRKKEYWMLLFLIAFSSIPVSMSAILIVPVMIVIILAAELIMKRDIQIVGKGILCLIPNGVYLIVYFLYTRGFKIPIA